MMSEDMWRQYRSALQSSMPDLSEWNPAGRHCRLEGVVGGQSTVVAYREVWFFVETRQPLERPPLAALLHNLRSAETDSLASEPPIASFTTR